MLVVVDGCGSGSGSSSGSGSGSAAAATAAAFATEYGSVLLLEEVPGPRSGGGKGMACVL